MWPAIPCNVRARLCCEEGQAGARSPAGTQSCCERPCEGSGSQLSLCCPYWSGGFACLTGGAPAAGGGSWAACLCSRTLWCWGLSRVLLDSRSPGAAVCATWPGQLARAGLGFVQVPGLLPGSWPHSFSALPLVRQHGEHLETTFQIILLLGVVFFLFWFGLGFFES